MGWVRVSDDFYDHAKFGTITVLGDAVWIRGLAYANRNLTDGVITERAARGLVDTHGLYAPCNAVTNAVTNADGNNTGNPLSTQVRGVTPEDGINELLAAGLWHAPGHDCADCPEPPARAYVIHDYLQFQPGKSSVEARREATKERVERYRGTRRNAGSNTVTTPVTNTVSNTVGTTPPKPKPKNTPSPNGEGVAPKKSAPTTGTRIPDPFIVNADMRQWAATETPNLDIDTATRTFVDHWRSVPGARGKKLDWLATWRNWLRKDWRDNQPRRGHLQAVRPDKDQRAADVIRMGQELQAAQDHNDLTGADYLDLKALPE